MINTKLIGSSAGIQRSDIIDKTNSLALASVSSAVIIGKFRRGRTDKPFKVTKSNYAGVLGRDIGNPSYLAVEDAFNNGISELWIYRIGNQINIPVYSELTELLLKIKTALTKGQTVRFGGSYIPDYEEAK